MFSLVYKARSLRQPEGREEDPVDGIMEGSEFPSEELCRNANEESEQPEDPEAHRRPPKRARPGFQRALSEGSGSSPDVLWKKKMREFNQLSDAIRYFMTVPLNAACDQREWLDNPKLCYYGREDPDYKRATSAVQRTLTDTNFTQIKEIMENTPGALWYARSPNHYMSRTESYKWIHKLLLFQYGDNLGVANFVTKLYAITEKVRQKKNTMSVVGPANCGKSWFFDMVVAFYINVGHVANFVRGQNFPLNDCINRRILYWNEPSIMPSGYESLKMLAGGDPCPASVKYQGGVTIPRTPLIMTSNHDVFPNSEVWTTRVYKEFWKPCPLLKEAPGYPSPWAFVELVENYVRMDLTDN